MREGKGNCKGKDQSATAVLSLNTKSGVVNYKKANSMETAKKVRKRRYIPGQIDPLRIFSPAEIDSIVSSLRREAPRSVTAWSRLIIFRLSCGMGLRVSEIADVRVSDMVMDVERPYLRVRCGKGSQGRQVPFYDAGTRDDLLVWLRYRVENEHAGPEDYLLVKTGGGPGSAGMKYTRQSLWCRFKTACRSINRKVTIHDGRHTWITYTVARVGLAQAQRGAGHRSLKTTFLYLGLIPGEDSGLRDLFGKKAPVLTSEAPIDKV